MAPVQTDPTVAFECSIATSSFKVLRRPLGSALAAAVAVMYEPAAMDGPPIMEGLLHASSTKLPCVIRETRQPTMRRAQASMTKAT